MQSRSIPEACGYPNGIFGFRGGTVEFKLPISLQYVPYLIDIHEIAEVLRERMDREIGDGDRGIEPFRLAVDRKERAHQ